MICEGCGNREAWAKKSGYEKGVRWETCDRCGDAGRAYIPDVYFPGPHSMQGVLTNPDGSSVEFTSRSQKSAYFRSHGISEAGDRVRGAPAEHTHPRYRRKPNPGDAHAI